MQIEKIKFTILADLGSHKLDRADYQIVKIRLAGGKVARASLNKTDFNALADRDAVIEAAVSDQLFAQDLTAHPYRQPDPNPVLMLLPHPRHLTTSGSVAGQFWYEAGLSNTPSKTELRLAAFGLVLTGRSRRAAALVRLTERLAVEFERPGYRAAALVRSPQQ